MSNFVISTKKLESVGTNHHVTQSSHAEMAILGYKICWLTLLWYMIVHERVGVDDYQILRSDNLVFTKNSDKHTPAMFSVQFVVGLSFFTFQSGGSRRKRLSDVDGRANLVRVLIYDVDNVDKTRSDAWNLLLLLVVMRVQPVAGLRRVDVISRCGFDRGRGEI